MAFWEVEWGVVWTSGYCFTLVCMFLHLHVVDGTKFPYSTAENTQNLTIRWNKPAEFLKPMFITKSPNAKVIEAPFLAQMRDSTLDRRLPSLNFFIQQNRVWNPIAIWRELRVATEQRAREHPNEVCLKYGWKDEKRLQRPPPLSPARDSKSAVAKEVGSSFAHHRHQRGPEQQWTAQA